LDSLRKILKLASTMTGDPIAVGMIIFDAAPSVVADVAVDTFERLAKSLHPGNKRQRYDVTLLQPSMETKEQTLKTKDLSQNRWEFAR
jgi:hypothetical protein